MKVGTWLVLVVVGLVIAAAVLSLTATGRGIMDSGTAFVVTAFNVVLSVVLGIVFFVWPWVVGGQFRLRFVTWLDAQIQPEKAFSSLEHLGISLVFGAVAGGLQVLALQFVGANAGFASFLASLNGTFVGPITPLAWFAYAFVAFVLSYWFLRGK